MSKDPIVLDFPDFNEYEFEQQDFIVEDLIVGGGIHIVYGREGVGKTQFLFTMIRDILNGKRFLGRYRTRACRLAYLSVDMPHRQLQGRTRKLDNVLKSPEDLLIISRDSPIDILELQQDTEWLNEVWDFDPDVIFVDTLHKIHLLDENVSQSVTAVFAALKHLFGGNTSFVIAHHAGKPPTNKKFQKDDLDKQRGSSAWLSDSDLGIYLAEKNTEHGRRVEVSFPRVRFCEPQPAVKARTDPETMTLVVASESLTARDHARRFLDKYPKADFSTVAEHLQTECGFAKSRAYEIAHEVSE